MHWSLHKDQSYSDPITKILGICDGLKGHILYYMDSRQDNQFNITLREIAEYVVRYYQ